MRTTRWIMVAIAVLSVVVAVAVPGYQFWLIAFGGVLIAWAMFGLLTERLSRPGNRSSPPSTRSLRPGLWPPALPGSDAHVDLTGEHRELRLP